MPYVRWHAQDLAARPLAGCTVSGVSLIPGVGDWTAEPTNQCGDTFTLLAPGNYNVTFHKPGYKDDGYKPATIGTEGGAITKGLESEAPPVVDRPPLPAFTQPINYRTVLPWEPPVIPTRNFLRGDFWGVEMDDAPQIPGTGKKYTRIFSWFLDRYAREFQERYLAKYGGYGYTHFLLSYADSTADVNQPPGKPPGGGQTLNQFIDTCLLVKNYVPYCHVRIGSKYFQPANMSAADWASFADPIMDALIAAGAVDEFSLGWEWNLWNVPGQTSIDALRHCGQKAHHAGLSSWQHFSPHVTSWFKDGDPRGRFGWYDDLAGDVDGLNYQTQGPNWSHQMAQARIVDTLWQFGERGNDYLFRYEEDYANWMWDMDVATVKNQDDIKNPDGSDRFTQVDVTPDYANMRGYLACCTIDNVKHTDAKVWGFGNGARRSDGSRL